MLSEDSEARLKAEITARILDESTEGARRLHLRDVPEEIYIRLEIEKLKGHSKREVVIEALVLYFSKPAAAPGAPLNKKT